MRSIGLPMRVLAYSWMVSLTATSGICAEEPPRSQLREGPAVGVVMAITGGPGSIVSAGASSRVLRRGDVVAAGELLHTGAGAQVDVLWDHRALLTLQKDARMHILEPHHGQTEVHLHHGSVQVALSYNAGRMTDRLTLQTPLARIVGRGGILEVRVMGGEARSFFARLLDAAPVETLRVFEGQVRVEPLNGEGKPFTLKEGSEVSLTSGAVSSVSEIQRGAAATKPLAITEEDQGVPHPVMRQIVNAQVALALDVEEELQQLTILEEERELPGTTGKGAILSTSTGLPIIPGIRQATASANSTGVPSFPTSPAVSFPSVAAPVQGAGAGVGGSQVGGLNTEKFLRKILNDVEKGGKGRRKK